eukprot:TRINITY_DN5255_c0_g1_i4.p1 TRINITY_DN5255_c0_g1~~TRINITY_DN5255_c0_g1_i4.p1  ORF type:complete len:449 (-),score=120.25 TRINITY_DN5255_c0_g1_i4:640-1986(-)
MSTDPHYQIPIVFQDLRKEESYIQLFHSLQTLDGVFDQVFTRIGRVINEEKSKLNSISVRLSAANAKVKEISKSSIAVTVLSPSKYPATEHLNYFKPIHSDSEAIRVPKACEKESTNFSKIPHLPSQFISNPGDCLILNEFNAFEDELDDDGLGRLPEKIPSVSSLLMFNSVESPYRKDASMVDNLASKNRAKLRASEPKKQLASAPTTLNEGDTLPLTTKMDVAYQPGLQHFPGLRALPSVLPLSNVAQVNWNLASDRSIAPSNTLDILPQVVETPLDVETSPIILHAEPIISAASDAPPHLNIVIQESTPQRVQVDTNVPIRESTPTIQTTPVFIESSFEPFPQEEEEQEIAEVLPTISTPVSTLTHKIPKDEDRKVESTQSSNEGGFLDEIKDGFKFLKPMRERPERREIPSDSPKNLQSVLEDAIRLRSIAMREHQEDSDEHDE